MSTPQPRLIGLGGNLRAGKDAVGDYLADQHDFVKMGMSDALNEALLTINPWIPLGEQGIRYRELHDEVGYVEAKKNPEVRRLLQVLGTEVGREMIDPDVWVKMAEKKIRGLLNAGRSVVITAMRFPNELEMLERLGGMSVWIERSAESRSEGLSPAGGTLTPEEGTEAVTEAHTALQAHPSENSVSAEMFHTLIRNNSTLKFLYAKTEDMLKRTSR